MRIILAVILVACGGSPKPLANSGAPAGEPAKQGTSGVPGLDWGATEAEANRVLPPNGVIDGMRALVTFKMGARGLTEVDIAWTQPFSTVMDCLVTWKKLRASYDGRFGESQSDNGAAYWTTPTAKLTLMCNLDDSGAGVLSMIYAQPGAD